MKRMKYLDTRLPEIKKKKNQKKLVETLSDETWSFKMQSAMWNSHLLLMSHHLITTLRNRHSAGGGKVQIWRNRKDQNAANSVTGHLFWCVGVASSGAGSSWSMPKTKRVQHIVSRKLSKGLVSWDPDLSWWLTGSPGLGIHILFSSAWKVPTLQWGNEGTI